MRYSRPFFWLICVLSILIVLSFLVFQRSLRVNNEFLISQRIKQRCARCECGLAIELPGDFTHGMKNEHTINTLFATSLSYIGASHLVHTVQYFSFHYDVVDKSLIDSIVLFRNVKEINFSDSTVTENQLEELITRIPSLKRIQLVDSNIALISVQKLRRKYPSIDFHHEFVHTLP